MFTAKIDDRLLFTPLKDTYRLHQPKITLEANKASSFDFTIYPDHPEYKNILKFNPIIKAYDDDKLIFRGRVIDDVKGWENEKDISCEGEMSFFNDSIVRPYDFKGSVSDYLKFLVKQHNGQVDKRLQFSVRNVTVVDPNDLIVRANSNYPNTLQEINDKLFGLLGGYFYLEHDEDKNITFLDYYEDPPFKVDQGIEQGKNLLDLTETIKGEDIATAIIPLGAKIEAEDGSDTGKRLTIASANNGKDYLYDEKQVQAFGYLYRTVIWDDVTTVEALMRNAKRELAKLIKPTYTLELKAFDLSLIDVSLDKFDVLHYVKATSIYHSLAQDFLITKLTIDMENPENGTVTIGQTFSGISDSTNAAHADIINTQLTAQDAVNKAIHAIESADGKSTNYYGDKGDGFPPNPNVGDLYFERDGDKTTVYQWDGTSWVNIIDGNWQTDFEQEMQDKLDQAKQENDAAFADLDKQLSDAQTAIDNVDASNQALSDAVDQANKDIQAVDDTASQAMSTALDGKSLAENAKELGQEALDNFKNLSIGGRNLISNSAFLGDDNKDGIPNLWIKGGATATSKLVTITDLNQIATGVEITQTALGQSGLRTQKFVDNIIGDKSYVQTFWIKNIATEPLNMILQTGERNKETNAVTYTSINQEVPGNSDWIRLSRIFNTKVTTNGIYFYLYTNNKTETAHYLLAAPKFEEGTVPTDWTPAPEDTQVKIEQLENGLKTTVSQSQYNADQSLINSQISSVTQTADSINSVVTDLTNGMPTGASIISQISDSVSIMVEKNDVINQINVSTEGILIAGEKVHITGTTLIDDAIITTAMIKELDASVITTGTLAANIIVPTAGNLLMNSEFQSNTFFDGWTQGASNSKNFYESTSSYTDAYGGKSYATGVQTQTAEVTLSNWSTLYQDVKAREGLPYSGSVVIRNNTMNPDVNGDLGRMGLDIEFLDSNKKPIAHQNIEVTTIAPYATLSLENQVGPKGTAYLRFKIYAAGKVNGYATRSMLNRGAKTLPYTASTGQVIVGSDMIVDGAIIAKHLSAESVTAEKLAVGAVNMGSAVVTGTLDANRINVINLDASQIKAGTLNAATVRIINLDASAITTGTLNVAVQINANSIVAGTLNAKLLTGDTSHLNSVDTGVITNRIDDHLQLGAYNATENVGQINITSRTATNVDYPGGTTIYSNPYDSGERWGIRLYRNRIMPLNRSQDAALELNPYTKGAVNVRNRDQDTWLPVNASKFNVISERKFKNKIQVFKDSALEIINDTTIYSYEKSGRKEIGVISDEANGALLSKGQNGERFVDLYSYSSIAIKAIQELTDEVDSLKSQIEEMEKKIA
ncbi:phage tail spike protein [Lactococcus formosensis]|uniref:phage tail spike protein n=1 Tax=Lactococcus formosensis TaxID=1281486 RepID=UPI00254BFFD0|nr:phage tail spike protein [Lactococcus formosensis]